MLRHGFVLRAAHGITDLSRPCGGNGERTGHESACHQNTYEVLHFEHLAQSFAFAATGSWLPNSPTLHVVAYTDQPPCFERIAPTGPNLADT
jgi:hypothetical protein